MAQSEATPHIALCMIVKNEAAVLPRCLKSVFPIISAVCLCDTGSSDPSSEIAEQVISESGIPFVMPSHEWVNFGINRTQAFDATRAFAQQLGWDLEQSYALFLDADMLLEIEPSFDAASLTANGYLLLQRDGTTQYTNVRLAKLSLDWRSVGVTHEYWTADGAGELPLLPSLTITHIGDGGAKADKFTRDIALLEVELSSGQNLRTIFYLARSYEDVGRYEEAHRYYTWRASAGGWEEEAWYAAYCMGRCSIQLGEWQRAVFELLSAWERRPQRAEPLYRLANAARQRGDSHLAMLAAERARRIPLPEDDRLFLETHAYNLGPLEEISISAYYTGERQTGIAASDALLHRRDVPANTRLFAGYNSTFYAQPLPVAWSIPIQIAAEFDEPQYSPGNTTIGRTDDGYLVVTRLLNYDQQGAVRFITRDPDGRFRSKNAHLVLDRDFQIHSSVEIDSALLQRVQPSYAPNLHIQGIEDLRLTYWRDAWWFTATSSVFDPRGYPRVILGRLNSAADAVDLLVPLEYDGRLDAEKNWLPFVHEDRLLLLYSYDPIVILEPNVETGWCQVLHRAVPEACLDRYRGSAPPIPFGDRYLFTIHEVPFVDGRRVYLHRFVEMDRNFRVTRVSRLFHVWHVGVEYNCGMCLNHSGDALLLTFSWEEQQSWIINVPLAEVEQMLLPVEEVVGSVGVDPAHETGVAPASQPTKARQW